MDGKLICFEGIDGSGKGSQINLLAKKTPGASLYAYPDKSWEIGKAISKFLGKSIRLSPEHQFFLYASDILKDQEKIKGELLAGKTVILDRYVISTAAYQGASGFPMEKSLEIIRELDFLKPDLTILLDIDPNISVERKKNQNRKKLERFERERFLGKVRRNYLVLAKKRLLSKRWLVLDGGRDKDKISDSILSSLKTNVY